MAIKKAFLQSYNTRLFSAEVFPPQVIQKCINKIIRSVLARLPDLPNHERENVIINLPQNLLFMSLSTLSSDFLTRDPSELLLWNITNKIFLLIFAWFHHTLAADLGFNHTHTNTHIHTLWKCIAIPDYLYKKPIFCHWVSGW